MYRDDLLLMFIVLGAMVLVAAVPFVLTRLHLFYF